MKRLYRIEAEKKIFGICAGLGEMLGVDANVVRLGLVIVTAATAFAPVTIAYIVAYFILPEKNELGPDVRG
jgi:phage shock protein PspC (stress-responsive transcriptional regulator)